MTGQKQTNWPLWIAAVTILLPVQYVASFVPVCRLVACMRLPAWIVNETYQPIIWTFRKLPTHGCGCRGTTCDQPSHAPDVYSVHR